MIAIHSEEELRVWKSESRHYSFEVQIVTRNAKGVMLLIFLVFTLELPFSSGVPSYTITAQFVKLTTNALRSAWGSLVGKI
jgi:hypothetical protein